MLFLYTRQHHNDLSNHLRRESRLVCLKDNTEKASNDHFIVLIEHYPLILNG